MEIEEIAEHLLGKDEAKRVLSMSKTDHYVDMISAAEDSMRTITEEECVRCLKNQEAPTFSMGVIQMFQERLYVMILSNALRIRYDYKCTVRAAIACVCKLMVIELRNKEKREMDEMCRIFVEDMCDQKN